MVSLYKEKTLITNYNILYTMDQIVNSSNYKNWNEAFNVFSKYANSDTNRIQKDVFCQHTGLSNFVCCRIFELLGTGDSNELSFNDYMRLLEIFINKDDETRVLFIFNILSNNTDKISSKVLNEFKSMNTTTNIHVDDEEDHYEVDINEFKNQFRHAHILGRFIDNFKQKLLFGKTTRCSKGHRKIQKSKFDIIHGTPTSLGAMFYGIFIILKVAMYIGVFNEIFKESNSICYSLARTFGFSMKITSCIIFLPILKLLNHFLRRFKWLKRYIKFEKNLMIHKLLGYSFSIDIICHITFHALNGYEFSKLYSTMNGITGIVLTFLYFFTLIIVHLRNKFYNLFILLHTVLYFWVVIVVLHSPSNWSHYLGILGLLCLNYVCMNIYSKRSTVTDPETTMIISKNIVQLSVFKCNFKSLVGGYYSICVPEISSIEWHPFSIASTPDDNNNIVFMIRNVGDWTKKLYDYIKLTPNPTISVKLMGPFNSPSENAVHSNKCLLIATGIGITTYLSVIQYYNKRKIESSIICQDCDKIIDNDLNMHIILVWIVRDLSILDFITKSFEKIAMKQKEFEFPIFKIKIHITSLGKIGDIEHTMHQLDILKKYQFLELINDDAVMFGRPDITKELESIDNTYEVYFCGNRKIEQIVSKYCVVNKINHHLEVFTG